MFCEIKRKWSYLDRGGSAVFNLTCSAAGGFVDGLADVLLKGTIGYIDKQGNFAIPPQFGQAGPFHEGLACVEFIAGGKRDWDKPQVFGYVNKRGEKAFAVEFRMANEFSEGLAAVNVKSMTKASYIDKTGKVVITDLACQSAGAFQNGLARITTGPGGSKIGYINRKGEYIWEPQG